MHIGNILVSFNMEGEMRMEFIKVTLGEISIGKGQYGIGASAVDYSDDLYTYLRITDINDDGTLKYVDLKSVNDDKASQYILQPNDIVFARTGNSTGRNYFYDGSDGVLVYAGFLIKFSLNPSKVNPRYVKYYCLSEEYKGWVQGHSTGSTRGNINAQTYASMEINLPPREQQDKLVSFFDSIEEKRKVNERINRNLQEQADAIYADMFVNSTEGTDRNGRLAELITVKYGKDHKKLADGLIPVYGSGGIMRYVERPLYTEESVLIPRKGSLNNVMYVNEPFWSVDTMFYTEMKVSNVAKFVYHFMKGKDLASMNAGSAVPSMTTDILNAMEVAIPSAAKLCEFEELVSPLYAMINANMVQSTRLDNLRDSLLPRLMSGELDVSDLDI